MKKQVLKIVSFVLSLSIGIVFVWSLNLLNNKQRIFEADGIVPSLEKESTVIRKAAGEIEVKFKEFAPTRDGLMADFEIVNNTSDSAVYSAYPTSDGEKTVYSLPFVKVGGKEVEEFRCGTGLIDYEVKPGESKIFRFNGLSYYWKEGKSIQIGFYFKKRLNNEYQTYWSENLPISDSIAQQLLKRQN
jgi:hypothetical protein